MTLTRACFPTEAHTPAYSFWAKLQECVRAAAVAGRRVICTHLPRAKTELSPPRMFNKYTLNSLREKIFLKRKEKRERKGKTTQH